MVKKMILLAVAVVFLLTSCALPGGSNSKSEEPTQSPAKEVIEPTVEEAQVEQPAEQPTSEPEAPAEPVVEPTAEEAAAPEGIDFRDEFDIPGDSWTDDYIVTTQAVTRDRMQTQPSAVQDGILEWRIRDAETYIYKFVKDSAAQDVVVEAKWLSKGQSLSGISLICRAAEDSSSWYEALISPQGDWKILRYDKSIKDADQFGQPYVLVKEGRAKLKLVKPAGDNISKFSCVGSKLTFEINGSKLAETNNIEIKDGGLVGVGVRSSTYLPAQILFDYFSATAP